jgi:hypothetical protein
LTLDKIAFFKNKKNSRVPDTGTRQNSFLKQHLPSAWGLALGKMTFLKNIFFAECQGDGTQQNSFF